MIKTYFVNVDTKEFCRIENPAKRGDCPVFYHGETAVFNVAFIRKDRTPFDVTGSTFCLAVDDNVKHDDELAILCENITDIKNNVITVKARCRTQKFADLVKDGEYNDVYCEIYRVAPGETERKVIAYCNHGVSLKPSVFLGDDVQPDEDPGEVTREEFDEVKTELETVHQIAEQAQETAENARKTANTAVGNANNAQTTANTAQQTAEQANTAAQTAIQTANEAKETANSANATANNAVTTANQAKTKSEQAITIANETAELVGDIDTALTALNANLDAINGEVIA